LRRGTFGKSSLLFHDWSLWAQFTLSIGAVTVALIVRGVLDDILLDRLPWVTVFIVLLPLVVLVRPLPFLVGALVGCVGTVFFFIPTRFTFFIEGPTASLQVALILVAVFTATLTAWLSKRALRRRRGDDAMLRAFVDDSPTCKWVTAADGRIVYVNKAMADAIGLPIERIVGRTHAEILPPELAELAVGHIRSVRESGQPRTSFEEIQPMGAHGVRRMLEWRRFLLRLDQHEEVLVAGMANDVTEKVRLEAALRDSEARHRTLFNVSVYGVITIDERGIIESANPAAERLFGYSVEELLGRNVDMLMPDPYKREHDSYLENYHRTGVRKIIGIGREVVGLRKDGSRFPMDLAVSEFRTGDKRYFMGIVNDTTERKEVEQALDLARAQAEAASNAKDKFLAVLSHELRTPLAPVLMSITAMHTDPNLPEALRGDVGMIRRNVELEARLIDDLLDLSRVSAGKLRLKMEAVEVNSAVRHVCETCRPYILEKAIRLHCDLPDESPFVMADPARLQQILWNLLRNAAKFTPEGGDIFVSVTRTDDQRVRIRVRDTGIGIAPAVLPRIFDAFEQGDANVTRQFGGLGLGLAISRALVEMHHGTIRAESDGPKKGSTFTLELPGFQGQPVARPCEEMPAERGNGDDRRLRVLVVEDHPDTARIISRALTSSGHTVKTAHTAASALELAAAEPFEVIVSDIGLPDATGYELMKQLKARYAIEGIAMSGYGTDEDIRKSREAGFSDHIVKPASITDLERALRRAARRAGGARTGA
jgi:PAS domain S-box-containing protein